MDSMTFVKLKDLDGDIIHITGVKGYKFAMWDQANHKMLVEDKPTKGYKKRWMLQTDRGQLEVSQAQMGKILEAAVLGDTSTPVGKTFSIKSNGRQDMPDYWFNLVNKSENTNTRPDEPWEGLEGY